MKLDAVSLGWAAVGAVFVLGSMILNPDIWSAPPALVVNGAAK